MHIHKILFLREMAKACRKIFSNSRLGMGVQHVAPIPPT
jgi:hypothetical protein